ncbi:MAG TPA: BREX-3 system phosphatase PglZ [Thermoanaerobaculia bacterium]|nr:BREX-3 system phosphatase PglZ [Thermoanaerobaculia bacterium]
MTTPSPREAGWRHYLLKHFTPAAAAASRVTVVHDPDDLISEAGVLEGLRASGFDVIPFDDPIAFRYAYETRYRESWDRGEETPLVVVLRVREGGDVAVPYDLLSRAQRHGRVLRFGLSELFPQLAPSVVEALDRSEFEPLWNAVRDHGPGELGENATKDFVLRHVFDLAPELVRAPAALLAMLLRRHFRGTQLPRTLDARLVEKLQGTGRFGDWPLQTIVPDRNQFFRFLEERWAHFVKRKASANGEELAEAGGGDWLKVPGPVDLPFDHSDVRVWIDNLFVEGILEPMTGVPTEPFAGTWMAAGVAGTKGAGLETRLEKLAVRIEAEIPGEEADPQAWIATAKLWAELLDVSWQVHPGAEVSARVEPLRNRIEESFQLWLRRWYSSLANLPFWPKPTMVHHVPHWMAHTALKADGGGGRQALLVLDGLSLGQWTILRDSLRTLPPTTRLTEGGAFAWVPTLTSVSRQAIFFGNAPLFFASSLLTTSRDESHWRRFWEDRGVPRADVDFLLQRQQEPDGTFFGRIQTAASRPNLRRLAVVISIVDGMLHGSVTGSRGVAALLRDWGSTGSFRSLLTGLLERGFRIVLTSDHGNVEAEGLGKPNLGAVADERGERVLLLPDESIRSQVNRDFPTAEPWPAWGLPPSPVPLLAPGRSAFLAPGARAVVHGGTSLEEVIVPFIQLEVHE